MASWPRLTGSDIPGRGSDGLRVAILGTAADAQARAGLLNGFAELHPEIDIRFQAVQGTTWSDFFAKLLTMVAAGTPPDIVFVATEGLQLFADKLAEPLDTYVRRDASQMHEYFADVHPALIEGSLYEGSLYQLPTEFNAANLFLNMQSLDAAGIAYPDDGWDQDDFTQALRTMKRTSPSAVPYYWVNRLWGGVVPWLYVNGTSFMEETRAPGGDWLWNSFYAGNPAAENRSGGYRWQAPSATGERVVEVYEYLNEQIHSGLSALPQGGGGGNLIGLFSSESVATTPAGGFWAQGLADAGMKPDEFDVTYFPRWRTRRHQFGGAGYMMMRTAKNKDAAWEFLKYSVSRTAMETAMPKPTTTPSRRSMVDEALYSGTGPQHWQVFYDTFDVAPDTGPIPAPPQYASIAPAFKKNSLLALQGKSRIKPALAQMQDELAQALKED